MDSDLASWHWETKRLLNNLQDIFVTWRSFLGKKHDATQYYNKEGEKKEGLLTISGFKQEKLTSSLNTL